MQSLYRLLVDEKIVSDQLRDIQLSLQAAVLVPDNIFAAETKVTSTPEANAQDRIKIYQDAYRLRLFEVLENDYPALHLFLGDRDFEKYAFSYIETHQSSDPSIRWYGEMLGAHLISHNENLGVAAKLAQFEWTIGLAFDAADTTALNAHALSSIPTEKWQTLQFAFHPSLFLIESGFDVSDLWQQITDHQEKPAISPVAENIFTAVWRSDNQVRYRNISELEARTLNLFLTEQNFGQCLAVLAETSLGETAPSQMVNWLREWFVSGWIGSFKTEN